MAQVVNANVRKARGFPYSSPWTLEVGQMRLILLSDDHVRVARDAGQTAQKVHNRVAQVDCFGPCLAIGKPELHPIEIDMVPF